MDWRNVIRRVARGKGLAGLLALGAMVGGDACQAGCGCGGGGWFGHWRDVWVPTTCPAPTGTYTRQLFDQQAAKAEADDFVIYKNEWYLSGTQLGPYGSYHITEILRRLAQVPFPVVIQPQIGDPALDVARRNLVVDILAKAGVPDAEQRVIVAFPQAEGLYADIQAERTYIWMMLPQIFLNRYFLGAGGLYGGLYGGGLYGGGLYGGGLYGGLFGGGGLWGATGLYGGW